MECARTIQHPIKTMYSRVSLRVYLKNLYLFFNVATSHGRSLFYAAHSTYLIFDVLNSWQIAIYLFAPHSSLDGVNRFFRLEFRTIFFLFRMLRSIPSYPFFHGKTDRRPLDPVYSALDRSATVDPLRTCTLLQTPVLVLSKMPAFFITPHINKNARALFDFYQNKRPPKIYVTYYVIFKCAPKQKEELN